MKKTFRASLLSALVGIGALVTHAATFADEVNWPTRPIQVVVIANPGGDTDFNARTMAKYFNQITGKTMVVTNVAGGGGTLAAEQVKGAAADGNTILFTHPGQLIVNEVAGLTEDSYETFDIACIAGVDKSTVFVASKQSGVTSMQDLVDKSKANPGSITYGTEMGSFSHIQGLMLEKLTGAKLKMVDGGTVSDRVVGMLGGRLDMGAITYGSVQDYVKGGQMVALGQPNAERNAMLGEVPTLKEQGLDITMDKPYVVAFPKGTDPAIVKKMSDLMKQITEVPAYAEDLKKFKQPVSYFATEDAKAILAKTREDFMQFKDDLRKAK
ncbi:MULTISPECIES: tripartite tricarboxylate transporter substrate binding protein [Pseudomonas]|uniref:Protein TctC n=2 Tax=Ectopseudomonas TaxID=3236654 RepID=A0A653B879_ECTOL|nr:MULTISPECIES: tripartite tricarboxylate transporter substrate binding protein [Pseudomonas]TNF21248.1 MAG: tripartite tricarboxylate transporter substrate binding protein [Pseudomonadales bacterium]CAE6903361.1 Protein TctC [Pseudomonas oleovorans]QFT21151.1 Tripartite tricarboxylate transporter family receptor [Pseudomonas sp. THAF187a]QFT41339.1 Tripartite tricarboxylate transporter family receptor [Pseudomonas sp. THAF42]QTS87780.1 tripartite tricarboxylate transporter substrate binding |tara:strand:+ start:950 stop:1927 length:978 start_codon:yes stop_codon:yes gene_type:complete